MQAVEQLDNIGNNMADNIRIVQQKLSAGLNTDVRLAIHIQNTVAANKAESRNVLGKLMELEINNQENKSYDCASAAYNLIMPNARYSISHCLNTIVAIASRLKHAVGIGVDLEYSRTVAPEAAKFFLSNREQEYIKKCKKLNGINLLRLWTIKEAVYKSDMDNQSSFWFFDYETQNPAATVGIATKLSNVGNKQFRYASLPYKDGFLTAAIAI